MSSRLRSIYHQSVVYVNFCVLLAISDGCQSHRPLRIAIITTNSQPTSTAKGSQSRRVDRIQINDNNDIYKKKERTTKISSFFCFDFPLLFFFLSRYDVCLLFIYFLHPNCCCDVGTVVRYFIVECQAAETKLTIPNTSQPNYRGAVVILAVLFSPAGFINFATSQLASESRCFPNRQIRTK